MVYRGRKVSLIYELDNSGEAERAVREAYDALAERHKTHVSIVLDHPSASRIIINMTELLPIAPHLFDGVVEEYLNKAGPLYAVGSESDSELLEQLLAARDLRLEEKQRFPLFQRSRRVLPLEQEVEVATSRILERQS